MIAVFLGAIFGFSSVLLGSLGAHRLAERAGEARARTWDRAVRYQMIHAAALVGAGALIATRGPTGFAITAIWLMAAGVIIFCGSLYVLAGSGSDRLSFLAPVGGVLLMAGWLALAAFALGA